MSSLVESPEYQAFARFVELTVEKRQLRARLKELEAALKAMQPALLGYLTTNDMPSFAAKNYLIYQHREPWVYPMTGISRQMVCEALKVAGLEKMVTENYSTHRLTSYLKQLEIHSRLIAGEDPGDLRKLLHPALAAILDLNPAHSLHIRKQESPLYADLFPEPPEEGDEPDEQP